MKGANHLQVQIAHFASSFSRRFLFSIRLAILLLCITVLLAPGSAFARAESDGNFPPIIHLPDGFNPEGIVIGRGTTFYVGSVATGAIFQGDLRTGQGQLLVQPQAGRSAVGLSYDRRTNWLYVAGGTTGAAYIYDAKTGATVATFQFTSAPTFINDEDLNRQGAFFTDSSKPNLYEIPLKDNGQLQNGNNFRTIPLSGDFNQVPNGFNANGIVATRDNRWLIIVHTALGTLYRVDPKTGVAKLIDLHGGSVLNGDGLLLDGKTLYVVQNFSNQISVVELGNNFLSGKIEQVITNPNFHVPTTIDRFGNFLYVVNSHFDVPVTPTTPYEVVQVPRSDTEHEDR